MAIERISLMQTPKGGFGLWSERSPEEPWLTAYATDFLITARNLGLNVPEGVLNKALKRLEYYVQRKWAQESDHPGQDHVDFAVRAYSAYVLAKLKRAPLGSLRTMFDNHSDKPAPACLWPSWAWP